jgi:hypothetical protein
MVFRAWVKQQSLCHLFPKFASKGVGRIWELSWIKSELQTNSLSNGASFGTFVFGFIGIPSSPLEEQHPAWKQRRRRPRRGQVGERGGAWQQGGGTVVAHGGSHVRSRRSGEEDV